MGIPGTKLALEQPRTRVFRVLGLGVWGFCGV